jgi:hypothetical protein
MSPFVAPALPQHAGEDDTIMGTSKVSPILVLLIEPLAIQLAAICDSCGVGAAAGSHD